MQNIINELTQIRKDKGLRQVDLAKAVGVTQPVISEFESGKTSPKLSTVIKYAHALGYRIEVKENGTD
jgi:predicted transcriptional regulator